MALRPRSDEIITTKEAIRRVGEGAKFSYSALKVGDRYEYAVDVVNTDGTVAEVVMDAKTVPLTFATFHYLQTFHFDHSSEKTITVPELPDRPRPKEKRLRTSSRR